MIVLLGHNNSFLGSTLGSTLRISVGVHEHNTRFRRLLHKMFEDQFSEVSRSQEIGLEGRLNTGNALPVLRNAANTSVVDQDIKMNLLLDDLISTSLHGIGIRNINNDVLMVKQKNTITTETFPFLVSSFKVLTASSAFFWFLQAIITAAPALSMILAAK